MSTSTTIEITGLGKSFGPVRAVDDLTFSVRPGQVTGFLGPNGAGKTTTLRMLLGLVRPTEGTATFGGTEYRNLKDPLATVGTALEASSFHPGRSARNHLRVYARAAGIGMKRVDAVLAQVGIAAFADRRVGGYSLGMRQRLGLAFALLGDPGVLVLDEPTNHIDITTKKVLKEALLNYQGSLLIVSHDRDFLDGLVSKVYELKDGNLFIHLGSFKDFLEKREAELRSGTHKTAGQEAPELKSSGITTQKQIFLQKKEN